MGIVWAVCKGIENEGYRRIIDVTANARARKKRKRAWYWGIICRRVNLGFSRRETAISPVTALLYYITPRAIVALYQFFSFLFFSFFLFHERSETFEWLAEALIRSLGWKMQGYPHPYPSLTPVERRGNCGTISKEETLQSRWSIFQRPFCR